MIDITIGIGFRCKNLDPGKLVEFCIKHGSTLTQLGDHSRELYDFCRTELFENAAGSICDAFYEYECQQSGCRDVCAVISNVITSETGLPAHYLPLYLDCEYIMVPNLGYYGGPSVCSLPDYMSRAWKWSEQSILDCLQKYADELSAEKPTPVCLDWLLGEYDG